MTRVKRDVFANSHIAHEALRGQVQSERFSEGELKRVDVPVARLCLTPNGRGTDRQILYGHTVRQLDSDHGLSRDETSGYVGYVKPKNLTGHADHTHRVSVRSTLLFEAPDIKSPDPVTVSFGSHLRIVDSVKSFAVTDKGRYVFADHIVEADAYTADLAASASLLIGTPYLWGGNSAFGIDCSGLVQIACEAAGLACPGDSDQQMETLGEMLDPGSPYARNDLLFWKGHVAIVSDPETMLHSTAGFMAVTYEPIKTAMRRIEAAGDGPCIAHKRL